MTANFSGTNDERLHEALASLGPKAQGLWTERMTAKFLQCSMSWLQKARFYGRDGPPYLKVGRLVRYVPMDVVKFSLGTRIEPLARRQQAKTSPEGKGENL